MLRQFVSPTGLLDNLCFRAQGRESTVVRVLAVPALCYVILLLPRYQPSLCLRALVIRVSGYDTGLVTASLSLLKLRKINPCVNRTSRNSLRVSTVWATLNNLKSESAQNCPTPRGREVWGGPGSFLYPGHVSSVLDIFCSGISEQA